MNASFRWTTARCGLWLSLILPCLLLAAGCRSEPTATPVPIAAPPMTVPATTATFPPATTTAGPTPRSVSTPSLIPSPLTLTSTPTPRIMPTLSPTPSLVTVVPAALTTQEAEPTLPAPFVEVDWRDAARYYGQQVAVEGVIVRVGKSRTGDVTFLNFDPDYQHTLTLVIFPEDAAKFPVPPGEMFLHRPVRVVGTVQEYRGAPEIIVRRPEQIEILGEAELPLTATPAPAVAAIVDWRQAAQYYGQQVTVEGLIVRTKNTGKVIFLNFDPDYRHTLTLVIFPDDAARFPAPPEEMFLQRRVRATGTVQEYQGAPEIIIRGPEQIEIVD
ncbi:MAG: hypothetical protein QHJ81_09415 [Anaerolineae bacterium]|nr:hypothetical protein [Anaerolineae bacterium]